MCALPKLANIRDIRRLAEWEKKKDHYAENSFPLKHISYSVYTQQINVAHSLPPPTFFLPLSMQSVSMT